MQEAIDSLQAVLDLPLVVVGEQRLERAQLTATRYLLVGEAPPYPEDRAVTSGVHRVNTPYLVTAAGVLCLSPGLIWDLVESHNMFGVYFVDQVLDSGIRYKSTADVSLVAGDPALLVDFRLWLAHGHVPLEPLEGLLSGCGARDAVNRHRRRHSREAAA